MLQIAKPNCSGYAAMAIVFFGCLPLARPVAADDYSFEKIGAASEAEGVSEEIAEAISDQGVRVKSGSSTVCELWLAKELAYDPDFTASPTRLYPFESGQLVGLLHFPRRGSEFRDQTVSSGWYTLRFGLQPIDGNHIGTSPTRDFLLLVEAEQDEFAKNWSEDELHMTSAEAAGAAHPAMLCLQNPTDGEEVTLRHDEANDWWVLHLQGDGKAGDDTKTIPLDVVVAGHAIE